MSQRPRSAAKHIAMPVSKVILVSLLSAALASFGGREWGTGYLTLAALFPLLWVLAHERRPFIAGLAVGIFQLQLAVVAGEGLVEVSIPAYLLLIAIHVMLYLPVGAGVAFIGQRWGALGALLSLPIFWAAAETLQSSFTLWGNFASPVALGYWLVDTPLVRAASLSGVTAVSFLALALCVTLYLAAAQRRLSAGAAALALVGVVFIPLQVSETGETLDVAAIQGSIPTAEQALAYYDQETYEAHLERYLQLSREASAAEPDLLLWPEAAIPGLTYQGETAHLESAFQELPPALMGGIVRGSGSDGNVAFLWKDSALEEVYRKRALLPFMESWAEAGTRTPPVSIASINVGAVICMDSVYGQLLREPVQDGAGLLVVLANSNRSGGAVHARAGILRAVETGRSLVHAAQLGPSIVVMPSGKVAARSALGEQAALTTAVPIYSELTLYVRFGNWLGSVAWMVTLGSVAGRVRAPQLGGAPRLGADYA